MKRTVALTLLLAGCATAAPAPTVVELPEGKPVGLHAGAPAPFDGVLITMEYNAEMIDQLTECNGRVTKCEADLAAKPSDAPSIWSTVGFVVGGAIVGAAATYAATK